MEELCATVEAAMQVINSAKHGQIFTTLFQSLESVPTALYTACYYSLLLCHLGMMDCVMIEQSSVNYGVPIMCDMCHSVEVMEGGVTVFYSPRLDLRLASVAVQHPHMTLHNPPPTYYIMFIE